MLAWVTFATEAMPKNQMTKSSVWFCCRLFIGPLISLSCGSGPTLNFIERLRGLKWTLQWPQTRTAAHSYVKLNHLSPSHNHRRTYNDCFKNTQKRQNLGRRSKKVLGLSWRDVSDIQRISSHLSGYELKAKQDAKLLIHLFYCRYLLFLGCSRKPRERSVC